MLIPAQKNKLQDISLLLRSPFPRSHAQINEMSMSARRMKGEATPVTNITANERGMTDAMNAVKGMRGSFPSFRTDPSGSIFSFGFFIACALNKNRHSFGGADGIRTHGGFSSPTVFKTGPINHSGTAPPDCPTTSGNGNSWTLICYAGSASEASTGKRPMGSVLRNGEAYGDRTRDLLRDRLNDRCEARKAPVERFEVIEAAGRWRVLTTRLTLQFLDGGGIRKTRASSSRRCSSGGQARSSKLRA